jgi:nucleolar MIF4G domain-containing protein 1
MVGQQLCRTSHSFQVTLQYCLWDFLRDLGESDVGGTALVQSLQDNGNVGETKSVPAAKIHNVARAYAWWVAKGCTTLSILKVSLLRFILPGPLLTLDS